MKVADKRISAAKVFIKSINAHLEKSLVGLLVKNSDVILLFARESVSKLKVFAVKFKRNLSTVFSVGIISGIAVIKTVDCKINLLGVFAFSVSTERLDCDCHLFARGKNLGEYIIIVKFLQ